jgi:hypothetical protein
MNKHQARMEALSRISGSIQSVLDSGFLYKQHTIRESEKIEKAMREIMEGLDRKYNSMFERERSKHE